MNKPQLTGLQRKQLQEILVSNLRGIRSQPSFDLNKVDYIIPTDELGYRLNSIVDGFAQVLSVKAESELAPGPWVVTHSPLNGYRVSDKTGCGVVVVLKDVNDKVNAKLIGSAPMMLDALEAMLKRFEPETHDGSGCMFKNCELCKADAAIRAAKGE